MLKSWKTSVFGLVLVAYTVVIGVVTGEWMSPVQLLTMVSCAGFLVARDNNVSSERAGAKR